MYKLINGEAISELKKLVDLGIKVDAIICDPPYGTTALHWDKILPTNELLPLLYKILKPCGRLVIFGNEPFYSYFIYDALKGSKNEGGYIYWIWSHELIWIKKSSSSPLMANQQPMRYHEKIMVLNPSRVGAENQKTPAYDYIKSLQHKYFKGLPYTKLAAIVCHTPGATGHFFTENLQWNLMPECNYNAMCSFIKQIDPTAELKPYAEVKELNEKNTKQTYNPYTATVVDNVKKREAWNIKHIKEEPKIFKGDKKVINKTNYPRSYCVFKNDYDNRHPTAKPLALMKHIIKLYTNQYDIVLDFTMGSGTTGRACVELDRHFIGIELNPKYCEHAEKWLAEPVKPENEQLTIIETELEKGGD